MPHWTATKMFASLSMKSFGTISDFATSAAKDFASSSVAGTKGEPARRGGGLVMSFMIAFPLG
jgi:hypothetical protein